MAWNGLMDARPRASTLRARSRARHDHGDREDGRRDGRGRCPPASGTIAAMEILTTLRKQGRVLS
eukprot:3357013-Prymnesium_polylepis.1